MNEAELQQANERLLEKRKNLPPTQTGSPTRLMKLLPQTIQKLEKQEQIKQAPVCKICGETLLEVWSDEDSGPVWQCSEECRKKRKEQEYLARLERKRENPEEYMAGFGIPKKHISKSLDNFKGNSKIVKICKDYSLQLLNSLFLTGSCGSGKTHLAVSVLREMVKNNLLEDATFITVPELLLEIRQTFQPPSLGIIYSETDVIESYTSIPFLILDDLGAEKASEWTITTLYLIIDRRNREERPTIFTSNLSLSEIEHRLSARIASRLADCQVIQLDMPDYRKKR